MLPILIAVSVVLTLDGRAPKLRPLRPAAEARELSIAVADFTLALAVQNLPWGFLQPLAGWLAVRAGFRQVMMAGACSIVAGLLLLALANGLVSVILGAGVLIGTALACVGSGIAPAVASRAVPAGARSTVLGFVTAAGSFGAMVAAPTGQALNEGVRLARRHLGFFGACARHAARAWIAGRVDKVLPSRRAAEADADPPRPGPHYYSIRATRHS